MTQDERDLLVLVAEAVIHSTSAPVHKKMAQLLAEIKRNAMPKRE